MRTRMLCQCQSATPNLLCQCQISNVLHTSISELASCTIATRMGRFCRRCRQVFAPSHSVEDCQVVSKKATTIQNILHNYPVCITLYTSTSCSIAACNNEVKVLIDSLASSVF